MDTSKKFIEMCWKAKEIQEHNGEWGDFYFVRGELFIHNGRELLENKDSSWDYEHIIKKVWLPRQDQLQKIIGVENYRHPLDMLSFLVDFKLFDSDYLNYCKLIDEMNYCESFKTVDQLWLVFVMWEIYKKRWTGKNWIGGNDE